MLQAFEFYDLDRKLFTAHHLRPLTPGEFQMTCDGIPVAPGWLLYRRGQWLKVVDVHGKVITCEEEASA